MKAVVAPVFDAAHDAPAGKTVPAGQAATPPGRAKVVKTAKVAKAAKAPKPAKVLKVPKADKPRKPKLVRDSFTIPKAEYALIDELKLRAAKLGQPAKKSEVLRAGLKTLAACSDEALLACLAAVPRVKTGRPAKDAEADAQQA